VEGSTRWWAIDADAMAASLRRHDEIIRSAIEQHAGYVFATGGDGFCAAFALPSEAVAAAVLVQSQLTSAAWPGPALSVRIGIHLGEAEERGSDYFGPPVNTAARVAAAGHGGQVLMTDTVKSAVGIGATDLGFQLLRDVSESVHLWQVGEGEFPALRTAIARSNVPTPPTRLFGRVDDVRSVRLMLAEDRLVTLVATGGTGKTRLAIEVADAELPHWRDGVWFVDLTGTATGSDVGPAVAKAIGFEARPHDRSDEIVEYLGRCELLLVLDNCEHVIDSCADLVSRILAAGGRSRVLATSREWLDIDGERVFRVSPLPAGGIESAAVKLFTDRAVAVAADFEVDDRNVAAASELCRRLDGVPLAIELAASRVAVLTPDQLVERLDDRFRLLSGGRRRTRHRTLEETIDWSYDLLEPDEQRVFRALGVFAGSFDIDAVASVCDLPVQDATDVVESLFARSLVAPSPEASHRFRLLETLKAYAEGRLAETDETDAVRERHCAHFRRRSRADTLMEAWRLDRCIQLLPDLANLVSCADWLEA
jgi:predicted ATPase